MMRAPALCTHLKTRIHCNLHYPLGNRHIISVTRQFDGCNPNDNDNERECWGLIFLYKHTRFKGLLY